MRSETSRKIKMTADVDQRNITLDERKIWFEYD